MRTHIRLIAVVVPALLVTLVAGCNRKTEAPDVKDGVKSALESRGYKDVTVDQDRDKGVVTLKGKVASDADKAAAASVAQTVAANQVVANEITVEPPGAESEARKVRSALDDGIDSNLKAAFAGMKEANDVKYDVNSQVVTLTGKVASQAIRNRVEAVAKKVPNVTQVVNEVEVGR